MIFFIQHKMRKKPIPIRKFPLKGEITIGNFKETFYSSLSYWKTEDYHRQWIEGLNRIIHVSQSCLVTNIFDPNIAQRLEWWILYKENETVFIQNELFAASVYKSFIGIDRPFTPDTCYNFITPRQTHTEDGDKISEWSIPTQDLICSIEKVTLFLKTKL